MGDEARRLRDNCIYYLVEEHTGNLIRFEDLSDELVTLPEDKSKAQRLRHYANLWRSKADESQIDNESFFDFSSFYRRCLQEADRLDSKPTLSDKILEIKETKQMKDVPEIFGNEPNEFTIRRKVLFLLAAFFGKLEVPKDVRQKDVIETITALTDNNADNIKKRINPTKLKAKTKNEVMPLIEDLQFVRTKLERLGMSNNAQFAINEINHLIADLEDNESVTPENLWDDERGSP